MTIKKLRVRWIPRRFWVGVQVGILDYDGAGGYERDIYVGLVPMVQVQVTVGWPR